MVFDRVRFRPFPRVPQSLLILCLFLSFACPVLPGCGGSEVGSVEIKADPKDAAGQMLPVPKGAKKGVSAAATSLKAPSKKK